MMAALVAAKIVFFIGIIVKGDIEKSNLSEKATLISTILYRAFISLIFQIIHGVYMGGIVI